MFPSFLPDPMYNRSTVRNREIGRGQDVYTSISRGCTRY